MKRNIESGGSAARAPTLPFPHSPVAGWHSRSPLAYLEALVSPVAHLEHMSVSEPHIVDRDRSTGWIEVICGSMFSGKTEELIRRLRRARIARQQTEVFKPALDTRYSEDEVVSHNENAMATTTVNTASQILLLATEADVVGIDEAQFFDGGLVPICQELANDGCRVLVVGLDQDYRATPFEPLPQLMAVAEHVTKLHAVCVVCGAPANHSQRIMPGEDRVLVGATEAYEPRCRQCFVPEPVEVEHPRPHPAVLEHPSGPEREGDLAETLPDEDRTSGQTPSLDDKEA